MKYPDFTELVELTDDDLIVVHQDSTASLKKIKLSALKAYIGVPSSGSTTDEFDSNVVLLMRFDGANNSSSFIDAKGKTVTPNGNVKISTVKTLVSGACAYFDGNGDYLSIPHSPDFNFGTGDFTIEFSILFDSIVGQQTFLGKWQGAYPNNVEFLCFKNPAGQLEIAIYSSDGSVSNFATNWSPIVDKKYFLTYVRSGNQVLLFVDGVLLQTFAYSKAINTTASALWIGGEQALLTYWLNGYMDDLRITKAARYTESFTIPSPVTLNPEATAVINAIQATGVTLTTIQKDACIQRIADMKASGVWEKRIAYYGFLGGTANSHAINWKTPGTHNITWFGNMTHSLSGIQGDGSNGYGDTGMTESLFTAQSTHISVYCRLQESYRAARDVGNASNDTFQLIIAFEGKSYYRSFSNNTNVEAATPPGLTGYFMGVRNAGDAGIYRNGVGYVSTPSSQGSVNPTPSNITICRAAGNYTSKQFASIGLGSGLIPSEAASDYTSEQAYQTALGRQV